MALIASHLGYSILMTPKVNSIDIKIIFVDIEVAQTAGSPPTLCQVQKKGSACRGTER